MSSISLVVERWSYVPEVAGSTPAWSSFDCCRVYDFLNLSMQMSCHVYSSISRCQLSLVAEHLLCKQKVGSSILPAGFFFMCNRQYIWYSLSNYLCLHKLQVCIANCMVPRGLMDMASDYESGDSGFESRRECLHSVGDFFCSLLVCNVQ